MKTAEIQTKMLQKLKASGLTGEDAKKLQMKPITSEDAKKLKIPAYAGFQIPYFTLGGKVSKFWRVRYLQDTRKGFTAMSDKKPMRYIQQGDTINEVYLPPFIDWNKFAKSKDGLVITEGELKAACATRLGIPTIGLGGVWCFKSKGNDMQFLPVLEDFDWKDREVYIVYDSDAVTNPKVVQAENALARELHRRGAYPFIVRLPSIEKDHKTGLDDFLVSRGKDAFNALLEEASDWRTARELHALNEEVVFVRDPGLVLELETMQKMKPALFTDHVYAPRTYEEEVVTERGVRRVQKSAAKEWIKWPHRSEAKRMTYEPGHPRITNGNELNMWRGWGVEPRAGDVTPWTKLLDYIFKGSPKEHRRWFEQWLAYPLQYPGTKLYSTVVVWGLVHGTGKSLIGYTMFSIYGDNATEIGDRDLHSTHNEWAENKQFVMGDEITGGDKRHMADRMKSMITQQKLRLNPKYIPSYTVPDCINYYFTSNHPDSFFLEDTDRRHFIHEVTGQPMEHEFYTNYEKWLKSDGASALFHYFLSMDLTGFNPKGAAPTTDSKREMIESGKSDLASWVSMLKTDPDTVLRLDGVVLKYKLWSGQELLQIYDQNRHGKVTANGMARELRRGGFLQAAEGVVVKTEQGQQRLWMVRDIERLSKLRWKEIAHEYNKEREIKNTRRG